MRTLTVLLALLGADLASAQVPPVLEAFIDGEIEVRNIRIDRDTMTGSPPVLWTDEINIPDADYIRLFIRVDGEGFRADSFLRMVSPLNQSVDMSLSDIGSDGVWSDLLPFGRVRLALVSETIPESAALTIEKIAVQRAKGALFSTWGENELKPINSNEVPPAIRARRGPIAFLSFVDRGFARTCTGFLIAADLMMTNEHCINSDETCRTMTAVFGYEFDADSRLRMGPQRRCESYDPSFSHFTYDVSLIRLSAPLGTEFGQIDLSTISEVHSNELFIIQHPGSQPKQVSFLNCAVSETPVAGRDTDTDFAHTCDTAGGSSGAPIFDIDGALVGVHHFGFNEDPHGRWTTNRGVHGTHIGGWAKVLLGIE